MSFPKTKSRKGKLVIPLALRQTSYSAEFVSKFVKGFLPNNRCSSPQSKKRLAEFRKRMRMSQGLDAPLFDGEMKKLLGRYVRDSKDFKYWLQYLNNLQDPEGFLYSRNLHIYSKTESTMSEFCQRDYTSFRWNENYQKALEIVRSWFPKHQLQVYPCQTANDFGVILPKTYTHSGALFLETGKVKKRENLEEAFKQYQHVREHIQEIDTLNLPILPGKRTQASGECDDRTGDPTGTCKHKDRVVSMIDLLMIMIELPFQRPFQEIFIMKECYAGGKSFNTLSQIIGDWRANSQQWISLDYSTFDMTISSWLIEDAFSIIKDCFILSETDEEMWNLMVHDFIHKDFVIAEGVIHSDKGVPSGSMWTQIIDSIVNVIVVLTYFVSIGQERKVKMTAMGDDNIIFCSGEVSIEELASYINKNFGLKVSPDKTKRGGKDDAPEFLSAFWTNSGRWRHPHVLIGRLLFPEKFRDYTEDVKPQDVLMAFILTYDKGMRELIDVDRFISDNPEIVRKEVLERVDSRYVPGAMAYQREYVFKKKTA